MGHRHAAPVSRSRFRRRPGFHLQRPVLLHRRAGQEPGDGQGRAPLLRQRGGTAHPGRVRRGHPRLPGTGGHLVQVLRRIRLYAGPGAVLRPVRLRRPVHQQCQPPEVEVQRGGRNGQGLQRRRYRQLPGADAGDRRLLRHV